MDATWTLVLGLLVTCPGLALAGGEPAAADAFPKPPYRKVIIDRNEGSIVVGADVTYGPQEKKLKSLVDVLNQGRIPAHDTMDIIIGLDRIGLLHGDLTIKGEAEPSDESRATGRPRFWRWRRR